MEWKETEKKDYALYFGRFSEEKGIGTLIKVCKKLPDVQFIFAGIGPLEETVNGIKNIRNFGKNNAEIIYSMIIYLLITGVSLSFLDIARIDVVPFLLLFLQTWKWDGDNLEELGYDG